MLDGEVISKKLRAYSIGRI